MIRDRLERNERALEEIRADVEQLRRDFDLMRAEIRDLLAAAGIRETAPAKKPARKSPAKKTAE